MAVADAILARGGRLLETLAPGSRKAPRTSCSRSRGTVRVPDWEAALAQDCFPDSGKDCVNFSFDNTLRYAIAVIGSTFRLTCF